MKKTLILLFLIISLASQSFARDTTKLVVGGEFGTGEILIGKLKSFKEISHYKINFGIRQETGMGKIYFLTGYNISFGADYSFYEENSALYSNKTDLRKHELFIESRVIVGKTKKEISPVFLLGAGYSRLNEFSEDIDLSSDGLFLNFGGGIAFYSEEIDLSIMVGYKSSFYDEDNLSSGAIYFSGGVLIRIF